MSSLSKIPLSILDLATIVHGDKTPGDAFKRSVLMAQHAEKLGYQRYWFAEHHNMESVASAATSVLIAHIAGATSKIRVGSGGVMLPNHAPIVIAEQFGTLEALFPGRIDLGLGRAPGTDQTTAQALRRNLNADVNQFPNDVVELINYLGPKDPSAKVRAIPGQNSNVPVWILGSSTFGAQLAAMLGLPFGFASHFAPTNLFQALQIYRENFRPSKFLDEPYALACVNVIIGDTDEEAEKLATSFYQLALGLFRNDRRPLPPPVDSMDEIWTEAEKYGVLNMMTYSFIGDKERVKTSLDKFIKDTKVNEVMVASHVYDFEKKKKVYDLLKS
jgi:luciferase family oxidoreductase group 1